MLPNAGRAAIDRYLLVTGLTCDHAIVQCIKRAGLSFPSQHCFSALETAPFRSGGTRSFSAHCSRVAPVALAIIWWRRAVPLRQNARNLSALGNLCPRLPPPPSTDPLIRGLDPAGHTPTQLSLPKFHFLAPALALYGLPLQRRRCSVVRRLTPPLLGAGRVLSQRRRGAPRVDESIVQGVSSCGAESAMQHCLCQVHFGTCE